MITGIIPSRYASTRFPGKPLVMIDGISMIERVYKQASKTKTLSDIIVATDDVRIFDHVTNFGGKVMMTSAQHQSGTDRCAEVLSKLENKPDIIVNIQGDEPYIQPDQIDLLTSCFENPVTEIATLIKQTSTASEIANPNVVKVVVDNKGRALFFSRAPIPFNRNNSDKLVYYKHIGIYGYKSTLLIQLSNLQQSNLEKAESLEQLR